MKKVVVSKELPPNLSLEEAQRDLLDDEEILDLDFELEALESRLALTCGWDEPCSHGPF